MRRTTLGILLLCGCGTSAVGSSESQETSDFARTEYALHENDVPVGRSDAPAVTYRLELDLVDRDGHAAASSLVTVTDRVTARTAFEGVVSGGHAELQLPAGQYGVGALISTPRPGAARPSITVACLPNVEFSADTKWVLDAQRGKRVTVSLDEPSAKQKGATFFVGQPTARGIMKFPVAPPGLDDLERDELYAVPTETVKGFAFYVQSTWTRGGSADSPYTYRLLSSTAGRLPDDPTYRVRKSELARVRVDLAAQGIDWSEGGSVKSSPMIRVVNPIHRTVEHGVTVSFPSTRIEYHTPGVWSTFLWQGSNGGDSDVASTYLEYTRPGDYQVSWGSMPLGPTLPAGSSGPSRDGDVLVGSIAMYADAEGHAYGASGVRGSTTLRRGDEVIARNDGVGSLGKMGITVPPEPATYELTVHAARDVPWSQYATEQEVTWRFPSQHTDGRAALPLMALRYSPKLDRYGRAPGGRTSTFEVRAERSSGGSAAALREMSVSISYDDGQTWQRAEVHGHGDERRVIVRYPKNADFVSLRGIALDAAGNSVTQTLIRAYGLNRRP